LAGAGAGLQTDRIRASQGDTGQASGAFFSIAGAARLSRRRTAGLGATTGATALRDALVVCGAGRIFVAGVAIESSLGADTAFVLAGVSSGAGEGRGAANGAGFEGEAMFETWSGILAIEALGTEIAFSARLEAIAKGGDAVGAEVSFAALVAAVAGVAEFGDGGGRVRFAGIGVTSFTGSAL